MSRSTDRILTTHAGSLPRPADLLALYRDAAAAPDRLEARLASAVSEVVRRQADLGVDIVNDGELGKPMTQDVDYGAWATYVFGRLSGYDMRKPDPSFDVLGAIMGGSKDRIEFAEFYASGEDGTHASRADYRLPVNVGPVTYTGHAQVRRDIANLKAALGDVATRGAFLSAVATGVQVAPSEHYRTDEEHAVAVAEAMREEYRAIVDAGLSLQIDDPILVNVYEFQYSARGDLAGFRKWAKAHVELVNHALRGIPEERIRYHVCWGSWKGPHSSDLPLRDVVDLLLEVNAGQYSVEAANPQHEHEWKVWKDVKLPDGRAVIPGVVTHKTNVLEHPELVADRIVRYADVVGRENVIAGTDCGLGGRLHPQLAWAKLRNLVRGAELATEALWG
ncbi:MAG TPA: cobalamin-independent methionine synthase II family protein [Gammaproteobacteria bacterium]